VLNSLRRLLAREGSPWFDIAATSAVEGPADAWRRAFRSGVAELRSQLGANVSRWHWGKLHRLTFEHPFGKGSAVLGWFLNRGPFPTGGSFDTVNPAPYRLTRPWAVYQGASQRHLFDLANMSDSRRVIPSGVSGHALSPHYDDQIDLWRSGRYRPFRLDPKAAEAAARHRLTLTPR
jgi:penicillin amidase